MKPTLPFLLFLIPISLSAQIEITNIAVPIEEDFEWFLGNGFTPGGSLAGSIDSDKVYTRSNSNSKVDFGDYVTTGEFARGTSMGGTSIDGGIYAFNTGEGNAALGIKPSCDFYNSGRLVFKLQNKIEKDPGHPKDIIITVLEISYDIYFKNTTDNITKVGLYFSDVNGDWTTTNKLNGTDFATPAEASGDWQKVTKHYVLTNELNGLSINQDELYFLKIYIRTNNNNDFGDEVAIDNLKIIANPSVIFSEVLQNPQTIDANDDEVMLVEQDEFIEFYSYGNTEALDLEGWKLKINGSTKHIFPKGSGLFYNQAAVVFGGGTPKGDFGGVLLQTASSGALIIPDSGEIRISLTDTSDIEKASSFIDSGTGIIDDAWHMDGYFIPHSTYPNSAGVTNTHSPGKLINNFEIYLSHAQIWNNKINNWTIYKNGIPADAEINSSGNQSDDFNLIINGSRTIAVWDVVCDNLTVNGFLTTSSTRYLIVRKHLIIPGEYMIESGGILHAPDYILGVTSIKRNSPWEDSDGRYSFIGSPVQDFAIGDLGSSYLHSFVEPTNSYKPVSPDEIMTPGMGYTSANKKELIFTGRPNSGEISIQISKNTRGEGYNLLSNPYSAPITYDAFMGINGPASSAAITGTIYIWDDGGSESNSGSTSDFRSITAAGDAGGATNTGSTWNGSIGSGQGFFVVGDSTVVENTVIFEPSMRQTSGNEDTHFFRKTTSQISRFKLGISNNETYYDTQLAFIDDAKNGYDKLYDGRLYSINEHNAKIYSYIDEIKYSVQAFAPFTEDKAIRLGIDIPAEGHYTIELKDMENVDLMTFILYDLEMDKKINLQESNYVYDFNARKGNNQNRFIIIASKSINNLADESLIQKFNSHYSNGALHLLLTKYEGEAKISIYDISGRVINQFDASFRQGLYSKELNYSDNKIYILHLQVPGEEYRTKFITN